MFEETFSGRFCRMILDLPIQLITELILTSEISLFLKCKMTLIITRAQNQPKILTTVFPPLQPASVVTEVAKYYWCCRESWEILLSNILRMCDIFPPKNWIRLPSSFLEIFTIYKVI